MVKDHHYKFLIVGYGINQARTEAISISTSRLASTIKKKGHKVDFFSVDQHSLDEHKTTSLIIPLIFRKKIISKLDKLLSNNTYTHIIDVFALPLSSILYVFPVLSKHPKIRYIKEIQNDYGHSKKITSETLIRFLANQKTQFMKVLNRSNKSFSRNKYIANKYKIPFLPTLISILNLERTTPVNVFNIAYLGHPLTKKGIFIFPKLFSLFSNQEKQILNFNFALSNIGPRTSIINILKKSAKKHSIKVSFSGKVNSSNFFRNNDIYILPIQDKYSAASTPNTILEAMEAGCAIVTTKTSSIQGVLSEENSILLNTSSEDKIYEAVLKLVNKPKFLLKIQQKAREYIKENHTKQKYLNSLEEIYG